MRRTTSLLTLAAIATGAQLALALPSHADTGASVTSANLKITAAAGKANNITIDAVGGDLLVTDTGDVIRPSRGCVAVTANQVRCSGVQVIQAFLGDGDDTLVNRSDRSAQVKGEEGRDTVTAGPGGLVFIGGPGDDVLTGGSGDDTIAADLLLDGADTFTGGAGVDTAVYLNRTVRVVVSLNGVADDGQAGERDNIGADVENIRGGKAGDTLTGNGLANEIRGDSGDDTINGLGDNDTLNGQGGADTVNGGSGDDRLFGLDGGAVDTLDGGQNTDTCEGGAEDTEISGEI